MTFAPLGRVLRAPAAGRAARAGARLHRDRGGVPRGVPARRAAGARPRAHHRQVPRRDGGRARHQGRPGHRRRHRHQQVSRG